MAIIYKITSPSKKTYVGVTSKSLARRKCQHISAAKAGSDYTLHRAIRKYGEALQWDIVAEVESFDEAKILEKALIKKYDSYKTGYNMTLGGDGVLGHSFTHSEKTKIKISEASKRNRPVGSFSHSQETKEKISKSQRGISKGSQTAEHRQKLSVQKIGSKNPFSRGKVYTPFGVFESTREAAETLGIPKGTVKARCRSARNIKWCFERARVVA